MIDQKPMRKDVVTWRVSMAVDIAVTKKHFSQIRRNLSSFSRIRENNWSTCTVMKKMTLTQTQNSRKFGLIKNQFSQIRGNLSSFSWIREND